MDDNINLVDTLYDLENVSEEVREKIQGLMMGDYQTVPIIRDGKLERVVLTDKLSIEALHANIVGWAHDRNLVEGATPAAQMLKMVEELGELSGGIAKNRPEVIKDSIGDVFVVLTILAEQLGMDMRECIEKARYEIKDRKGNLIKGVFVMEEDL